MKSFLAGLLCAVFGVDPEAANSATKATPLILSVDPVEVNNSVQLRLESSPANNSISIPLFLRQSGTTPILDVGLVGQLEATHGGTSPTVEITRVTGNSMPPWVVPPTGKQIFLKMTVSGLTADDRYTGVVYANQDGALYRVAELDVTRFPKAELQVIGTDKTDVTLTSPTATVVIPLQIESRNSTEVTDLRFAVSQFTDLEGDSVVADWTVQGNPLQGAAYHVSQGTLLGLQAKGEFRKPGTYKATLSLNYADKHETVELQVKRERVVLPIEIKCSDRADGILDCQGSGLGVSLALQETSGKDVTAFRPQLVMLTSKVETQQKQTLFENAVIRDDQGQKLQGDTIELKAGQLKRLRLDLTGVSGPGELTALIRVAASDYSPRDHTITIMAKQSVWIAVAWIGLGILISLWLRHYRQDIRPLLQGQERSARLRRDLATVLKGLAIDAETQQIVEEFERRLDKINVKLIDGEASAANDMSAIEEMLPLFEKWLQARKRISTIQPDTVRPAFVTTLAEIRDYIIQFTVNATQAHDYDSWFQGLESNIADKTSKEWSKQLQKFKDTLEKTTLPDDFKLSAADKADKILRQLKNPPPNIGAEVAELQSQMLIQAIKTWNENTKADRVPVGFLPAEWKTTYDHFAQEFAGIDQTIGDDFQSANNRYQLAMRDYYRKLVRKLSGEADKRDLTIMEKGKIPDEITRSELKDFLQANVKKPLSTESLKQDFDEYRFTEIAEKYDRAVESFKLIDNQLQKLSGGADLAPQDAKIAEAQRLASVPVPTLTGTVTAAGAGPVSKWKVLTAEQASRKANLLFWVAQFLVALVAVLLGTQLVWANSPTWGSWTDYISALLLGLGVHQVGDKKLNLDPLVDVK